MDRDLKCKFTQRNRLKLSIEIVHYMKRLESLQRHQNEEELEKEMAELVKSLPRAKDIEKLKSRKGGVR